MTQQQVIQPRVDIDSLSADLAAMRTRLDTWSQDVASSLHNLSNEHVTKLQESKVALRNLDTKQHALEVQAKAVCARLAAEEAEVEGMQHTLSALREQETSLPQRVDQLSRVLETKEATIASREKELAQDVAGSRKKLQALQQAVDLFQQRLGLAFHQPDDGSGELQLVFSHLSEQHPDATGMVAVRVANDETYSDMQALVETLNTSKNFASFVCSVRRRFQGLSA